MHSWVCLPPDSWSPAYRGGHAQAAGTTAQVWEITEAGHTGGLRSRTAEYERRVIGFLDEALGLGGGGGRDL